MSSYSLGEELAGLVRQRRAVVRLQDEVAQLFEEARDDVYRYLLTLGLYPPEAQEAAQEVFLRLYATLKKGELIRNRRAWIFRVAHNFGLKIRAQQKSEEPFDANVESRYPNGSDGVCSFAWKVCAIPRSDPRWASAHRPWASSYAAPSSV